MSAYMVDKLIRTIEMSDRNLASYMADTEGFVAEWERRGKSSRTPVADGGQLTEEEKRAFIERDYGELYRLGAHPYLLWHFTEAIYIGEYEWPVLKEMYRDAVRVHGEPDFIT